MNNKNNTSNKRFLESVPIWVLVVDFVFLIFWVIGKLSDVGTSILTLMRDSPDLLRNLSTFTGIFLGVKILEERFYKTSFGERRLNNLICAYDNYDNYEEVKKEIHRLLISRSDSEFDCPYYDISNQLNSMDENYKRVWNDFNHFSNKVQNGKNLNDSDKRYLDRLQKYVWISIYEKYKSSNP